LVILVAFSGLWMGAISWRLLDLQIRDADTYRERAARQQRSEVVLNPKRGTIYDARGRTMAVSVETRTLYAETAKVADPAALAATIAPLVGRSEERIEALLQKSGHVPLARKLDRDLADGIDLSAFPGLYFLAESKREYPMGSLMAHVLGFVGTDRSLAGLELRYDDEVAGEAVRRHVLRDGQQRLVVVAGSLGEPKAGADLHLTIDATIQHLAERVLRETIEAWKARAGNVVILAPEDSAVLAMASYPAFDPNQFGDFGPDERRNRAIQDSYEPGSTFKTITAAGAFERQVVHADQIMDCGNGFIRVGKARIRDHKPFPELTFRTAIAKSSNVCAIKAGQLVGGGTLQDLITRFGFGAATGIDVGGEHPGIVPLRVWDIETTAYASFGHGLAVTPLQLANAYAAIANGGTWNQPYIVRALEREGETVDVRPTARSRRVISKSTAYQVIRLLEEVVVSGTGRKAAIAGYRVAGKTGTAEKSDSGGYSETGRVAGFVGIAPARAPRLVCLVMIDEPTVATGGGEVAAPAFQRIVSEALFYLGATPSRQPMGWSQPVWLLPAEPPEVKVAEAVGEEDDKEENTETEGESWTAKASG
jgi:cell division protein FtsI (penicillin-binding protein 3)